MQTWFAEKEFVEGVTQLQRALLTIDRAELSICSFLRPSFLNIPINLVGGQQLAYESIYRLKQGNSRPRRSTNLVIESPYSFAYQPRLLSLSVYRVCPTRLDPPAATNESREAVTGSSRSGFTFSSAQPDQCVSSDELCG